jgi:hypothetical protein
MINFIKSISLNIPILIIIEKAFRFVSIIIIIKLK